MEQSIKLRPDELRPSLIIGLKKYLKAIKASELTITFSTPKKKFLYHETQEKTNLRIENSIANMEKGNFVSFSMDEFIKLSKALSKNN